VERLHSARDTIEPEAVEQLREMICKALPLHERGRERAIALVHERALREQPRVHVVEQERGSGGHLDELPSLRRQLILATEGSYEFLTPRYERPSRGSPLVNRVESAQRHPGFKGAQAGACVGAARGHAVVSLRSFLVGGMTVSGVTI
jgi:hypothetical protein